jgi:hypothetical protein
MTGQEPQPSVAELDALPTEDLRRRAFDLAESKKDLSFFWDLMRHLPPSDDIAAEDASSGNITGSLAELAEMVRQMAGSALGDYEPLIRARYIDYLRRGE